MPDYETFLFQSGKVTSAKISYLEYGAIEKIRSVISELAISQGKDWLFGNKKMTFQSLTFVYNSGRTHQTTN